MTSDQLEPLRADVVRMAALAGEAIENASDALLKGDLDAAERLIAADHEMDQLSADIEERVFQLFASGGLADHEVRSVMAAFRVIRELERIGDNMVNVAKAARRLFAIELGPRIRGTIQLMREQASLQLRVAVQAFVENDTAAGSALPDLDDTMDSLEKDLLRQVFDSSTGDDNPSEAIALGVQLALIGRFYERAADHTVTFAERVR